MKKLATIIGGAVAIEMSAFTVPFVILLTSAAIFVVAISSFVWERR